MERTPCPKPNGTVSSSVNETGVASSYVYDCNNVLPTQTTVGGLISHVGWDCNNALGMSTTDPNGNGTRTTYDLLNRPSSYTDLANLTVTMSSTSNSVTASSVYGTSITTVDGYGRTIRNQRSHGSSYDTETTTYNVSANAVKTSVPCIAALGTDCTTGFTTATIDITGKPMSVVDGVNATSTLTYAGSTTEARVTSTLSPPPTGENTKTAVHSVDGLGRATSDCSVLVSGGGACGHGSGNNGVLTGYTYSTGSGSTAVTATRGSEIK